jgi:methylmalonyl-CoA mutase
VTGDLGATTVYNGILKRTLSQVRGTVQADILKEDQAYCIFSTEFALRLMGDVQNISSKKCKELLFGFNIRISYC